MKIRHGTGDRVYTAAWIALVLWIVVVVTAHAGNITPFTGTWRLNVA